MDDKKKIFLFITSEKHPSPFDLFVMYDAGADAVASYGNVLPEEVQRLVVDAMFSRGPKGIKNTAIFVGGNTVKEGEALLAKVKETLFPPFEISVAFDPRGACTTSASIVALIKKALREKFHLDLAELNVSVLAGAGNVGSMTSFLLASEGARVSIIDVDLNRANEVVQSINRKMGKERTQAFTPEELYEACAESSVVVATGPPGVRLMDSTVLKGLSKCKLVVDINPVPPHGIEGIKPDHKLEEIIPGTYGIGSKMIGALKLKVERAFLKTVLEAPKGVFGCTEALKIADNLVSL